MNRIGIHYRKKIGKEVHAINVGVSGDEESMKFFIFSGPTVYAAGFFYGGTLSATLVLGMSEFQSMVE